jgi:hypothetical protein
MINLSQKAQRLSYRKEDGEVLSDSDPFLTLYKDFLLAAICLQIVQGQYLPELTLIDSPARGPEGVQRVQECNNENC